MMEVDIVGEYKKIWELAKELADKEVEGLPDMVVKTQMPKEEYKQDRLMHHVVAMVDMFMRQKDLEEAELETRE